MLLIQLGENSLISSCTKENRRIAPRSKRQLIFQRPNEEAAEQPPHLILLDPSFLVYRRHRRKRTSSST